jgi:electron transfer flavoprotein alpha subunit
MTEIFVLAEHRKGELRDISFEMLTKGNELANKMNAELSTVLLGKDVKEMAEKLTDYANKVILIEDDGLENFNSEAYQDVLSKLITERKPILTMIGQTSFGMDLAPSLATQLNLPLATDCIDLSFENGNLITTRQIHGGKVNTNVSLSGDKYMVTVRSAAFEAKELKIGGEITPIDLSVEELQYVKFIDYVEAAIGEIDITAADVLVSVGRGIGDAENISMVEELAEALGGVVACSRPVVDKKWLPKERQVGTSGKTVKPKLYIAIGISGAFQHLAGMQASDTIIAINKDPNAPIFTAAEYGIVDDLFKVVPALTSKIKELKG